MLARVALVIRQPFGLIAPINVVFGLPNIYASTGKAKRFESIDSKAQLPAKIIRSAQEIF